MNSIFVSLEWKALNFWFYVLSSFWKNKFKEKYFFYNYLTHLALNLIIESVGKQLD